MGISDKALRTGGARAGKGSPGGGAWSGEAAARGDPLIDPTHLSAPTGPDARPPGGYPPFRCQNPLEVPHAEP